MFSLVSNPGSNSRKYSVFHNKHEIFKLLFDPNDHGLPTARVVDSSDASISYPGIFQDLNESANCTKEIIEKLDPHIKIGQILIRIVAAGEYFAKDHVVDEKCIEMLEKDGAKTPLHAPVTLNEIYALEKAFPGTKIALISDSKFHADRPDVSKYYGFSTELADAHQIRRFGAHGLSMESIVYQLMRVGGLPEKLIVCHIGSGASVTAIKNGKSVETTMGYTPLEGVMMATRCGDIDPSAVFALKRALGYSDEEMEKYLNQQCGLLGIAGSNDFRDIDKNRSSDPESGFAYERFIYRIQQEVGKMAASMGGVDAIVLTATISERSYDFRKDLMTNLEFLGFKTDDVKNASYHYAQGMANIARFDSKPIWVIQTNETERMLEHAAKLL